MTPVTSESKALPDALEKLKSQGIEIRGAVSREAAEILTEPALKFLASLARKFETRRRQLLEQRVIRQKELQDGKMPGFLPETASVRDSDWKAAPTPQDLLDRRVEITGPVDRKMIINALNSGANVFMADLEDSNSPTWSNNIEGQLNLRDAVRREITYDSPEGKQYRLAGKPATLLVRPRGWHLVEKHVLIDSSRFPRPCSTSGCFSFTTPPRRSNAALAPISICPKMESHLEARLWNDVFLSRPGIARNPAWLDPRHRSDRDDFGRLRDGRNPLRAAGTFRRTKLRPLGLHLQLHQEIPEQARLRAARSRAGHDGRQHFCASYVAPPDPDLSSRGTPRHGRDGGADSDQERSGGQCGASRK